MKVIENNYKNKARSVKDIKESIITYCDNCDSKLEIIEEDTHIGWLGARFVTCPCCRKESMVDEMEGIDLTLDNIKFPVHFLRTNKDVDAKEVTDNEIVEDIKKGIAYLRIYKDKYAWTTEHGDLFLAIFKYDGDEEYFVVVTKDFYETNIPFTDADKK